MAFELSQVVPWGRSFGEYVSMFALTNQDLQQSILACADGPASFNCELTQRGGRVVSIDPLYEYPAKQIRDRLDETFETVITQTRKNKHEFVWKHVSSIDELGRVRKEAMDRFLSDYDSGRADGRYSCESLPSLSFDDKQFDLALCSHFLFLYSAILDLKFHIAAIQEMCRVARETRVFPLLQLGATPSPHVPEVVEHFRDTGLRVGLVEVPYEFQRGGNSMLRVSDPRSSPGD